MLLYLAFFLPTTINTAWVSVAAGVGILILPEQYNWDERTVEGLAVVLIVLVTAVGKPLNSLLPVVLTVHTYSTCASLLAVRPLSWKAPRWSRLDERCEDCRVKIVEHVLPVPIHKSGMGMSTPSQLLPGRAAQS